MFNWVSDIEERSVMEKLREVLNMLFISREEFKQDKNPLWTKHVGVSVQHHTCCYQLQRE